MTERSMAKPGLEFQADLKEFFRKAPQGEIFNWQFVNIHGEPIEMDIIMQSVDQQSQSFTISSTIRLNGRPSIFYLVSSEDPADGENSIGEQDMLRKWLDTIAKELRGGMHQRAIVDCINVVLLETGRLPDDELYDYFLEELSKNRTRSILEIV